MVSGQRFGGFNVLAGSFVCSSGRDSGGGCVNLGQPLVLSPRVEDSFGAGGDVDLLYQRFNILVRDVK